MVLFGYIARMARAGTIEALDADYTRTAFLKGLPTRTVIRRHVLRNSLLPTIAVIATQMGYLIGGLVVIEKLFNYNGIGQRIFTAAQNKDFTMLAERRARDRDRLPGRDAGRRHPLLGAQPAHPPRGGRMSTAVALARRRPTRRARRSRAPRDAARAAALEDVHGRHAIIFWWWVFCAFFGCAIAPHDPLGPDARATLARPSWHHLFGTDQLGRDVLSRVLAGARSILDDRPARDGARDRRRARALGLVTGYFARHGRRRRQPAHRRAAGDPADRARGRRSSSSLGHSTPTLIIVVGVLFTPLVARTVRAAVLAERELDYVPAARLRGERAPLHHVRRDPAERHRRRSSSRRRCASATRSSRSPASASSASACSRRRPTGRCRSPTTTRCSRPARYWWTVLFPALAIASLVIAINLIADGITQVLER